MAHIPVCSPEEASEEVRVVYQEFYTQMRFTSAPTFIMTQGHSPAVARGTWDLVRGILVSGELARCIKEIMFVAISHDRNCRYCTRRTSPAAACSRSIRNGSSLRCWPPNGGKP